jgi:anti-sigma factor ChrR (cupin superfamily)
MNDPVTTSFASVLSPAPDARLREQLLEIAAAPSLPIDVGAYAWAEPVPGVRIAVVKDEPERGFRACLVWADPGARHPDHRHHGEELIYVMQGGLRDHRGEYLAGDVCRSGTGSVHSEEVLPLGPCFCYALYYGPLEML